MKVRLPDYPFHPNTALEASPELLDGLADEYVRVVADGAPEMERFLFGFAPLVIFDRVLAEDAKTLPARGLAWIMHLSGHFGGAWLRAELRRAQPGGMLANLGQPPSAEVFAAGADRCARALEAAEGPDPEALAYAEGVLPELIEAFGYNLGYLLQIVEAPPAGLETPPDYAVADGPLWVRYSRPRLAGLAPLRLVSEGLTSPPSPAWRRVGGGLLESQQSHEARGRQVWSSGLSVEGFGQQAYDQLLDVSASFLEIIQASALTAVRAVAEMDPDGGRHAALAHACVIPWLSSYAQGLMDNRADEAGTPPLPVFEPER